MGHVAGESEGGLTMTTLWSSWRTLTMMSPSRRLPGAPLLLFAPDPAAAAQVSRLLRLRLSQVRAAVILSEHAFHVWILVSVVFNLSGLAIGWERLLSKSSRRGPSFAAAH